MPKFVKVMDERKLYFCFECRIAEGGYSKKGWIHCRFCGKVCYRGFKQERIFSRLRNHNLFLCTCNRCSSLKAKKIRDAER